MARARSNNFATIELASDGGSHDVYITPAGRIALLKSVYVTWYGAGTLDLYGMLSRGGVTHPFFHAQVNALAVAEWEGLVVFEPGDRMCVYGMHSVGSANYRSIWSGMELVE